jgi:type VI secretion system protein ImpC
MPGRMELDFQVRAGKRAPSFGGDTHLRILLLGDFSGRASRGVTEALAARPIARVDAERFDAVLAKLAPRLVLAGAGGPVSLDFAGLDDFHPDQLLPKLAGLPDLVAATAPPAPGAPPAPAPTGRDSARGEEDTMARLLGGGLPPAASTGEANIRTLLASAVAPHITPAADPARAGAAAARDEATAQRLRALLHAPAFQRLEAAWRAVHRLVHSLESEDVTVFLLDVSRAELGADLAAGPEASTLHERLAATEPAWSLLIVDELFGPGAEDVGLLTALGAIAKATSVPLIAGADPRRDWGALTADEAARWRDLRRSPFASAVGLALPRWLLRAPYAPRTNPIESFAFQELAGRGAHEDAHEEYLWGNPAFACALLAAAAFRENGADMSLGDVVDIDRLPHCTYRDADGEVRLQPCAETFLTERAAAALIDGGFIPLASARDRNAVRVLRFQSIADPPAALSGPWK